MKIKKWISQYEQELLVSGVLLLFLILFVNVCIATHTKNKPQLEIPSWSKWEVPVRQWDNSWIQTRFDTNTGLAEMRIVLER